jgi:hypothetical protein
MLSTMRLVDGSMKHWGTTPGQTRICKLFKFLLGCSWGLRYSGRLMPDVSRHHGGLIFKGRNGDETTRRLETSCTKQQVKFGGCNTVLSGLLHAYIACFGICKVTLCSFLLMAISDTWGSRIGMSLKGFRRSCLQVAAAVLPHLLKTNSSSIGGVLHSCCI